MQSESYEPLHCITPGGKSLRTESNFTPQLHFSASIDQPNKCNKILRAVQANRFPDDILELGKAMQAPKLEYLFDLHTRFGPRSGPINQLTCGISA